MKKITLALLALLFVLGLAVAPVFAGDCDGGCCPVPPPADGNNDSQGCMPDGCGGCGGCGGGSDSGPDGTDDGGLH